MPRMVREWHPIEEFTALTSVMFSETDPRQSLEANFLPEIVLHVLGFLPVQEVMKQKVRAVWLTHLFNLVQIDSLQPLSDVPMAREFHPIEEFTALTSVMFSETDPSLSYRDRLLSTRRLHGDSSEGFQGCLQLWQWLVAEEAGLQIRRRMAASSNES
eukprot:s3720_g3.t1